MFNALVARRGVVVKYADLAVLVKRRKISIKLHKSSVKHANFCGYAWTGLIFERM